jgi:myosin heavy subunit
MLVRKIYSILEVILFSLGNISLIGEEKDNSIFSDEEIIEKIKK